MPALTAGNGLRHPRGTRDLAKTERDSSIAHANEVARQMPGSSPSPNASLATSRTSQSTAVVNGSDTSEDELARDEVAPVKRLRPSAASSVSSTTATRRDARNTPGASVAISKTTLAPLQNTISTARRSGRPPPEGDVPYSTAHKRNGTDRSMYRP